MHYFFKDLQTMNIQGTCSPLSGSQGTASVNSPISTAMSPFQATDFISLNDATVFEVPYLTILEQPVEKFRFRYKSEMVGTHGSLVGSNSNSNRHKNAPTVQLHNFMETAIIQCTLVTSNEGQRIPHAHRLVHRDGGMDYDDPHYVKVSADTGYTATFHGMAIIHTAKKYVKDELIKKMRREALQKKKSTNINATLSTREDTQIKSDAECHQKHVNLNSVALCFQAFILDEHENMIPLTEPVYSNAINNLKSALTGELKICRLDKHTSSVEGDEEIFILVEKVQKRNIKIKFFELNEDDCEIWSAYGRFSELDVHHQYAIVFRTPPYRDCNITSPKEVFIQLERGSDGGCSDPKKKRQRMSHSGSSELSYIQPTSNHTSFESISEILNGNSQEISKELKEILSEGVTSPLNKDFLDNIDFDKYLLHISNGDENALVFDGSSTMQHQDDIMFARNTLIEIMQCMKKDVKGVKEHIQKLLKTPLHYAVLQNRPGITKALLILGADPNRTDEHGFSPLHVAVKNREDAVCVDVLLSEKGTNIEVYNDAGWTPLHLAAQAGSYDAVCSLHRAGANVNSTDMSYGRTALHVAVEGGHKNIVEYLLKKTNISVNKRNFSGNTALHTAVVYTGTRANELCALLIQHGADPHIQNHNRDSNDVGAKDESCINVKVEADLDDENTEKTIGQSSFDLAMNKPDETTKAVCSVATKLELKDEVSEISLLNNEHKQKLSILLDKTQGWLKLAKHLNIEHLLRTFQHSSSPSLILLNYIDVDASVTLMDVQTMLSEIGEEEAADYINEILSICS
ncbi:hypothetical protein WN48_09029 [Eufriesea mexicana]|nr:hypothetical protein WN48_09029 [Eufriesea mexicana]